MGKKSQRERAAQQTSMGQNAAQVRLNNPRAPWAAKRRFSKRAREYIALCAMTVVGFAVLLGVFVASDFGHPHREAIGISKPHK